jgi:hypothetical protein
MLSARVLPLAAVLLCLACALLFPSSVSAQDGPLTCAPFQLFETPTQLNDTNKCQAFKQNACCGAGIAARAYNVSKATNCAAQQDCGGANAGTKQRNQHERVEMNQHFRPGNDLLTLFCPFSCPVCCCPSVGQGR